MANERQIICYNCTVMHDLDKLDPDWVFAANHGRACAPGRPVSEIASNTSITGSEPIKISTICECCLNVINKQPVSLCQNSKQLQFLGFGFPLYFVFLKYAIILLVLQIVSYSALSIYWGVQSSSDLCNQHLEREIGPNKTVVGMCSSWLIIFMRTESTVETGELILRFSSFVIQLLGLVYIRDMLRKTNDYYDERTTSLSDYSIIISYLPKQLGLEGKIKSFLKEGMEGSSFKAEEMVLLNQLEEFYNFREEKRSLIKQKQKWMDREESEEREAVMLELDNMIALKDKEIEAEYTRELELIAKDKVICEKAILIMETEQIKDELVEKFEKIDPQVLYHYFGEGSENIEIDEAPEPKEIIWENINYPHSKRIFRLILGWSLTAGFLAVVTGVFFGILYGKGHAVEQALAEIKKNPDSSHAHTLEQQTLAATILTMLSIIFFNKFLLSFVLHWFTDLEKHTTGGEYEFSFGLKYTLGLFFTTAVMTLLVEDITFHNIYKEEYGVVEEQSIMFFFNSFLVPLIWFINPWHIVHLLKRKFYLGKRNLTQKQANDLMEDSKYSMGKKYAEIVESVWFTYLYASLIPIGNILITFGMGLFYWVDKYNLLRKSSINQNVSSVLSIRAVKLLDLTLILRPAGELLFDSQIREGYSWQSIVCMCIGVVYVFLPMNHILELLHEQKFKAEEKPYGEVKGRFIENYRTMHPLFTRELYTLLNGMQLTTKIFGDTRHFLNETTEQMLFVKPAKENLEINYN